MSFSCYFKKNQQTVLSEQRVRVLELLSRGEERTVTVLINGLNPSRHVCLTERDLKAVNKRNQMQRQTENRLEQKNAARCSVGVRLAILCEAKWLNRC